MSKIDLSITKEKVAAKDVKKAKPTKVAKPVKMLKKIELENQFQQMADFTLGVCATTCKKIGSCCSIEYCELAMETGKEQGVNYEPTGNKKLPMLDTATNTCIVAPHHRPLCTLHQCDIAAFGFIRNDPKATMTYHRMRESLAEKFNESLK